MSPDPPTIDVYWRLPSHGDPASVRDATLVRGDWTPTTAASLAPGRGAGRVDDVSYVEHLGRHRPGGRGVGVRRGAHPVVPADGRPVGHQRRRSPGAPRRSGSWSPSNRGS